MDPQSSFDDLQKEIEELTMIPPEYQEIEHNGAPFLQSRQPLASFQNYEELRVKHKEISLFVNYKTTVERVLNERTNQHENAKTAVEFCERLHKCGIFFVYHEFFTFRCDNHSNVAAWADDDVELIRRATREFFENLHDEKRGNEESEFICYFEQRKKGLGGRPADTIAFVKIHGDDCISEYNIKSHHYGLKGRKYGEELDVFELLCYKLLSLIGVYPKVYIIPPIITTETKTSAYIATKWDDRFQSLKNVIKKKALTADVVVQLVMIKVILFVEDLYDTDCGKWKDTENAAVADFVPDDYFEVYENIKRKIMTMGIQRDLMLLCDSVRDQYDENTWLKIAKVYFEKWDLANKIDLVREDLDPSKGVLKVLEIGFQKGHLYESPTDQFNEYIDTLRKNLENLQNVFNSIVQ
ncbi:unnamed protein product [Caenorhabditis nigoni]